MRSRRCVREGVRSCSGGEGQEHKAGQKGRERAQLSDAEDGPEKSIFRCLNMHFVRLLKMFRRLLVPTACLSPVAMLAHCRDQQAAQPSMPEAVGPGIRPAALALSPAAPLARLFPTGTKLETQDGRLVDAATAVAGKHVLVFFSAHWYCSLLAS